MRKETLLTQHQLKVTSSTSLLPFFFFSFLVATFVSFSRSHINLSAHYSCCYGPLFPQSRGHIRAKCRVYHHDSHASLGPYQSTITTFFTNNIKTICTCQKHHPQNTTRCTYRSTSRKQRKKAKVQPIVASIVSRHRSQSCRKPNSMVTLLSVVRRVQAAFVRKFLTPTIHISLFGSIINGRNHYVVINQSTLGS